MSRYTELVKPGMPRLVIDYNKKPDGTEEFPWRMEGEMPVSALIGYLARVSVELCGLLEVIEAMPEPCDEVALIVVWFSDKNKFGYFLHPSIPVDSLIGSLEVARALLVDSQVAQYMQTKMAKVVGPNRGLGGGRILRG